MQAYNESMHINNSTWLKFKDNEIMYPDDYEICRPFLNSLN